MGVFLVKGHIRGPFRIAKSDIFCPHSLLIDENNARSVFQVFNGLIPPIFHLQDVFVFEFHA